MSVFNMRLWGVLNSRQALESGGTLARLKGRFQWLTLVIVRVTDLSVFVPSVS